MTEPTRTICSPWVSLPDLPESRKPLADTDEASDDAWEALCWQASEMLYELTARQFSGGCESQVEVRSRRPYRSGAWVAEVAYGSGVGWPTGLPGGHIGARGGHGALVAALPGRPVTEIVSVTLGGETLAVEADLPAGLLWRLDRRPWPTEEPALVRYKHGAAPPTGGVTAARTLTLELGKAQLGDTSCQLPQRVQTLTRQGVTVGFRDSFESLDSNRTGIWTVDAFIASVNPAKLSAPPSVWSPDAATTRRKVIQQ